MWGNMFGEITLDEADYTVVWENAQKLQQKNHILIKPKRNGFCPNNNEDIPDLNKFVHW